MQWLMLQQEQPEDFVIATGEQRSVREFVDAVASELGMSMTWKGSGADEKGYHPDGRCIVAVDPHYYRPTEVESLLGDAAKAQTKLGWKPRITFEQLVTEMVRHDLDAAKRDTLVKSQGYKIANPRE